MRSTQSHNDNELTLWEAFMNLDHFNQQPFFTSMEPTKCTDSEGCCLLLTSKQCIQEAEAELNNLTDYIESNVLNLILAKLTPRSTAPTTSTQSTPSMQ